MYLFLYDLALGLFIAILGAVSAIIWRRFIQLRNHSFIKQLSRSAGDISIVSSSIQIEKFHFAHHEKNYVHKSPKNVLFSPLHEGIAVAHLIEAFRVVNRKLDVRIRNSADRGMPDRYVSNITILIGGPSVNAASGIFLKENFPEFRISYPNADSAAYKNVVYNVLKDSMGLVSEDVGFIFSQVSPSGHRTILLCGILAFGSYAAADTLINMNVNSPAGKEIVNSKKFFCAISATVKGFSIDGTKIVTTDLN